MTEQELIGLWDLASTVDPTLRLYHKSAIPQLRTKRVKPGPFSRLRLFSRMTKGLPSLFTDFPVFVKATPVTDRRALLLKNIKTGFPRQRIALAQVRSSQCVNMKVSELIRCWERGRSVVSVTDLHFRGTKFEKTIEAAALSDFNILCLDPALRENLEMMTIVISSRGNLTDIHTDDCDGSNHCFLGKKLWLSWDRMEGTARGFEDVDRDDVRSRATFDLRTFLSLPSSHWFVVSENQTLFLPGHLSHKVVTLEDYIGVGSFHVALPSYVMALRRWILHDTLNVGPDKLLDRINRAVIRTIRRLQRAPNRLKERWGLNYLPSSIDKWQTIEKSGTRRMLMQNQAFSSFLDAARKG